MYTSFDEIMNVLFIPVSILIIIDLINEILKI